MDDGIFLFDMESEEACNFTAGIWKSLSCCLSINFREPSPGERAGFDVKSPNIVVIVTPNVFGNDQVKEGFEKAVPARRNFVFLHHTMSYCDVMEEIAKAPEEFKKQVDKAVKDERIVVYVQDVYEQCNDMLLSKLNLREGDALHDNYQDKCRKTTIRIIKNSAKISKARSAAGIKRKYDIVVTSATVAHSPDGMPVVNTVYDMLAKLAPALCVVRNTGDKLASADLKTALNLVVNVTKDAFTCQPILDDMKSNLEMEGNIMLVHHLVSCPGLDKEVEKCEDEVLASTLKRVARYTYLKEACLDVIEAMLAPTNVKTDDTQSPRTRQSLSSGGSKQYKLEFQNHFAHGVAEDGQGDVYSQQLAGKEKPISGDIDGNIKALFQLYDPKKKGIITWQQFAEIDRMVIECLGGQDSEMISRRVFSMMTYDGLTLEADLSFQTFHNYHAFVAKQMCAVNGDRDASMQYKHIVDKLKNTQKVKKRISNKVFDLMITHDMTNDAKAFAKAVKRSIATHTPNIRVAETNTKSPRREKITSKEVAAASLNVMVLLGEDCLKYDAVQNDLLVGAAQGARISIMTDLMKSPHVEAEKKKAPENVQAILSRPAVVEYWRDSGAPCCSKMLELLQLPAELLKRPTLNRPAVHQKKDNLADIDEGQSHVMCENSERQLKELLARMEAGEVELDVAPYAEAVRMCSRRGDPRGAQGWLDRMIMKGLEPSAKIFSNVVKAWAFADDRTAASGWLQSMVPAGHIPGASTYATMIEAYANSGKEGAARRLRQEKEKEKDKENKKQKEKGKEKEKDKEKDKENKKEKERKRTRTRKRKRKRKRTKKRERHEH